MIKRNEPDLLLYYHPLDSASRNVLSVLDFLGLHVGKRLININLQEHKRSHFLSLNPNGELPVLTSGRLVLWGAHAITQYLASLRPGTVLWPEDPGARADIAKWQFWDATHLSVALNALSREKKAHELQSQGQVDPGAIELACQRFDRCARILNTHLSDRSWLSGSCISLADLSVSSRLMHDARLDLSLHSYLHLQEWNLRVESVRKEAARPVLLMAAETSR
ncbi:MAG: glutathione S-transferase family protein [Pseudoxanthomonas sp.]